MASIEGTSISGAEVAEQDRPETFSMKYRKADFEDEEADRNLLKLLKARQQHLISICVNCELSLRGCCSC